MEQWASYLSVGVAGCSGFYEKAGHGDLLLAHRGFLIADELAVRGASLAIPAFTRGKSQLSQKDMETSRRLAR